MTDIPSYAFDPVRQAAIAAVNRRSAKPIVDIRCAVPYSRRSCAKPLGGAYATPDGVVILLNRLKVCAISEIRVL